MKFTRVIPGNVCVQDKSMVKAMYSLVLIQYRVVRVERIL